MTGVAWLDWTACAAFVAMAVVLGVQLARGHEVLSHRASGLHVVMALGMAAMSQPRFNPLPAEIWMVAFAVSAAMAPFRCRRAPGHAVHHVVGSLFMVVAFAAGHGAHTDAAAADDTHRMVDPVTGETVTMAGASHAGHHAHGGASTADASGITSLIGDAAGWPVWPLVGVGFAIFAVWHVWGLCGRRFPVVATTACPTSYKLPDLTCGALMAAAMATMAFML